MRTENDAAESRARATPPEQIESAAAALSGIHDLLNELLETLSAHLPPQRVSPSRLASLQRRLDQVIAAIEDMVKTTCVDGRSILGGRWKVVLTPNDGTTSFLVSSAGAAALGDGAKKLSHAQSGGPFDLFHAPLEEICEIVAKAAAQIALQRQQLTTFVRCPVVVSDAAIQVAAENRAAAEQATSDFDLVQATSQITRGYLLAAAQTSRFDR